MTGWPRQIVIVGGGTAGWLAALILGDAAKRVGVETTFTVIESSRIGTIGVGEGTTSVFRQMLMQLEIDEAQFLAETGATIKFGIRHKDWRRLGHSYDGPIDDANLALGETAPILDQYAVANRKPVAEAHLFQHLLNAERSPFAWKGDVLVPVGPFHHAYHFDQALAGAFLRKAAKGVQILDDQVLDVERDGETGEITALSLESGAKVSGDFFIDCTGFRRKLINAMGAKWVSYADMLPVNRAMPFWLDIPPEREITPATLAHAQGAGWMWQIPTRDRMGCGYVYSDAHLSPDDAQAEIERTLGHPIEPRNDLKIDAGRLDTVWRDNCVAIGLASSFLEPLEATSIHGSIVQLLLLSSRLGDRRDKAMRDFNQTVARQVDDFRDFIRLHYVSERRDTAFWTELAHTIPPHIEDRLALWQDKVPDKRDFPPFAGKLPHVEHQLYTPVLDGLGLLNPAAAKAALAQDPATRARARKGHAALVSAYRKAAGKAMGHRAYLDHVSRNV